MTVLLHTWVQQMIVLPTHTWSSADEYATPHQGPADECAAHSHSEGIQQICVLPTHTRSSADECAAPHQGPADECAAHNPPSIPDSEPIVGHCVCAHLSQRSPTNRSTTCRYYIVFYVLTELSLPNRQFVFHIPTSSTNHLNFHPHTHLSRSKVLGVSC